MPNSTSASSSTNSVEFGDEATPDYILPKPFFDTYSLVKGLMLHDLTKEQSEALQSTFQAILDRR